ncbi:hypothetical protein [Tardiphaga sp.]|uniref:hypothetical protein n=1 Tax=Tardiphaga sp. TaxID=1926292 RepID=UPI00352B07B4
MLNIDMPLRDTKEIAFFVFVPALLGTIVARFVTHRWMVRVSLPRRNLAPWPTSFMIGLLACPAWLTVYVFANWMAGAALSIHAILVCLLSAPLIAVAAFLPLCLVVIPMLLASVDASTRGRQPARSSVVIAICAVSLCFQYYYALLLAQKMKG